jgi:hypothetical protein
VCPASSSDLTPCDYYLWGSLKDSVYINNPHTEDELVEIIRRAVSVISRQELQTILVIYSPGVRVEGGHFQQLALTGGKLYNKVFSFCSMSVFRLKRGTCSLKLIRKGSFICI